MKLPFFNRGSGNNAVYFGIFLKEKEGVGMVFKAGNSDIELVDQEKFTYTNGWEHLVEDIDNLIVQLEQRTKSKLEDTIFFLFSHFIDEKTKEIKKPFLSKIKDLVKNLNLKALGYIECYEAIINNLEKKDEQPFTGIILELDVSDISIFVYKRGKTVYTKTVAHTNNLIEDLLICFNEIKGKFVLPSRIILYNTKDLDNEATEIVTYRWSEEYFVQLPRVEIIKEYELIQGLMDVFAGQIKQKTKQMQLPAEEHNAEVMGFVIGGDVKPAEIQTAEKKVIFHGPQLTVKPFRNFIKTIMDKVRGIPDLVNKRWTIALGLGLILLGIFSNEYFFHKATLTVLLPSRTIKKDLSLTAGDIKIQSFDTTLELNESKPTTGKKEIGEKAKGSVSLHNFDDSEKTFAKGTIFESGGINFVLDSEVKVASASVVTINGGLVKQPGKSKGNVTAELIGPQGNLSGGKQFKIADFPTSLNFGMNESSFSGGSKKEVKTASKQDRDELLKNVVETAKNQNKNTGSKNKTGTRIISPLTEISIVESDFDKEIGEEAEKLSIQAKVKTTFYYLDEKEITRFVISKLSKDVKKGFILENQRLSTNIKEAKKQDDKINITIAAKGSVFKEISKEDVMKSTKGKNKDEVKKILKEKFQVGGLNLEIEPKLPFFRDYLPFFEKNINIIISSL